MSHTLPRKPVPNSANDSTAYVSLATVSESTEFITSSDARVLDQDEASTPQPLARRSHILGSLTIDLISISISIALFIFAVTGYCSRDRPFAYHERRLLDIARIVRFLTSQAHVMSSPAGSHNALKIGTAFPFIFAFIIGRLLQNILQWRLEKSVDGLSLAYLSRSFTLGSALAAPLRIRLAHWLPILLLLLWALSPLGSQASLRFIYQEDGVVVEVSPHKVQYTYPSATWDSACSACQPEAHNAVFLTPFLSQNRHASQDTWGNVKIPLASESERRDADPNGWVQLDTRTDREYSSLVGIPSSKLNTSANMSFAMNTWYWEPLNEKLWANGTSAPLLQLSSDPGNTALLTNFTSIYKLWQFAFPKDWLPNFNTSTVPLTFELAPFGRMLQNTLDVTYEYGTGKNQSVRLDFEIQRRPVELNVTCASSTCHVTAIRNTSLPSGYRSVDDMQYFKTYFLSHLSGAFPVEHHGTPFSGALEAYLLAPTEFPYTVLQQSFYDLNLGDLDAHTLAHRLCQVLNSYWVVDNQFEQVAGGFNASDVVLKNYDVFKNSSVTTFEAKPFLKANDFWFSVFCVSSLTMTLGSIISAALVFLRLAPDALDFLSTITLHGERHSMPGDNSYMSFDEKVRLYRDVRFSIGDIRPGEKVGQVAIGQGGELGALQRGRLYV
ncbi:hypothetical protein LIA77_09210 [Sarocladium implicatum]|nr:hypothetical protein LIA77_09210 [Sarocladium implicatum]